MSPALAGEFFTTGSTWEAYIYMCVRVYIYIPTYIYIYIYIYDRSMMLQSNKQKHLWISKFPNRNQCSWDFWTLQNYPRFFSLHLCLIASVSRSRLCFFPLLAMFIFTFDDPITRTKSTYNWGTFSLCVAYFHVLIKI